MKTYQSSIAAPYVYKCIHTITGQYYIGYREHNVKSNTPSHKDLPSYKTSSKYVNAHFNDFAWQIIAEFLDGDSAYDFEQFLIHQHWGDPLLLNNVCYHGKQRFKGLKGFIIPEEQREKISKSMKGHQVITTTRQSISETLRKDKHPIIIHGQYFISYSDAARALNASRYKIKQLLSG